MNSYITQQLSLSLMEMLWSLGVALALWCTNIYQPKMNWFLGRVCFRCVKSIVLLFVVSSCMWWGATTSSWIRFSVVANSM